MAKTTKKTIKRAATKKAARIRVSAGTDSLLDRGALAHRQLLLDPCNAPLSGPCYGGAHSGIYRRMRRIVNIPATQVEGVYFFQLGSNTMIAGGHIAANAGTSITIASEVLFTETFNNLDNMRPIAGCVKVRYTGNESARQGVIGLATGSSFYSFNGSVGPVDGPLAFCPVNNRVGEVVHEVKFVPGEGDQQFSHVSNNAGGVTTIRNRDDKSEMAVVFRGIPAGSLQLEVTMVYEADYLAGGVWNSVPPASKTTLSQLLRSLGAVSSWAFSHVVAPTIRSAGYAAMNTLASGAMQAAERMSVLAL